MKSTMKLTSPKMKDNGDIPIRYTLEGENISPPLEWSEAPKDSKYFALICDDLDAPKESKDNSHFTHWLIYNIPAHITFLPEGIPAEEKLELPILASQGENSFGKIGYSGPMPPAGSGPHRYIFMIYAYNKELDIKPGAEKNSITEALEGNILATAQITVHYERVQKQKVEKEIHP